jgi:hypothetical protein
MLDLDSSFFSSDIFSSPIHKPCFSPGFELGDRAGATISMPGFGSDEPSSAISTFGIGISDVYDTLTIFDMSKFVSDLEKPAATKLPVPQIKPKSSAVFMPNIFRPFVSVESTELSVRQLRAVFRRTERRINQTDSTLD